MRSRRSKSIGSRPRFSVFQSPPSLEGVLAGALRAPRGRCLRGSRNGSPTRAVRRPVPSAHGLDRRRHLVGGDGRRIWRDLSADTVARRAMHWRCAISAVPRAPRAPRPRRRRASCGADRSGEPQLALSASFPDVTDAQRRLMRGLGLPWAGRSRSDRGVPAGLSPDDRTPTASDVEEGSCRASARSSATRSCATAFRRGAGCHPAAGLVGASEVGRQAGTSLPTRGRMARHGDEAPAGVVVAGRIGSAFCLHVADPSRVADWLARQNVPSGT